MKKIVMMAMLVAVVALVSCGGAKKEAPADSTAAVLVTDSVAVMDSAGDTTVTEEVTATPVK